MPAAEAVPYYEVAGSAGGGGASSWGSITGTLADQTDLQTALDLKHDGAGSAGQIPYFTDANTQAGSANFLFDSSDVAIRLGVTGILSLSREKISARLVAANADSASSHGTVYAQYTNSNDTAFTSSQRVLEVDYRRTVSTNITDSNTGCAVMRGGPAFTVGAGATLTMSQMRCIGIVSPSLSGAGALALATYAGLEVFSSSTVTGARKFGVIVQTQTGGTTANIAFSDASGTSASGSWGLYLGQTNASHIQGAMYVGGTTAHSFNTEKLSVTDTQEGGANNVVGGAVRLIANGAAFTNSGDVAGFVGGLNRVTAGNVTDSSGRQSAVLARFLWTISGTYTNASTNGVAYFATSGFPATGGTQAITHFSGFNMTSLSVVTGTNAYGVRIQGITAANTANYGVYIGDITSATTNYAWYSGTGRASYGDFIELRANHDPGAPTDAVRISSKVSTDAGTPNTLHFRTEQAEEATATFTQTHRLRVWVNNTEYYLSLDAV
jgi:hypothetical protein